MPAERIVSLAGHARPHPAFARQLGIMHGDVRAVPSIIRAAESSVAIDALAGLLTEALETQQAADGRIDMKDVAAFVLRRMGANQK